MRRSFDFIGWQQVRLPPGLAVADAVARYKAQPEVLEAEPNYIVRGPNPTLSPDLAPAEGALAPPNDPRFAEQYALAKIGATNAWQVSTGDSNIVVAIIDTGINYTHQDLSGNMWRNPGEVPGNGIDDDSNGYVDDVYGIDTADDFYGDDSDPLDQGNPGLYHGTACAGVIGALANNGVGIAGLNWQVQLMAIRVLRTNNSGTGASILDAYGYVILMKDRGVNIKAINMSYGGGSPTASANDALLQITERGILAVAAAGNSTNNSDALPIYPASYNLPGLVSVAATDQNDALANFSNWGRTNVDLAAPGVSVLMTGGPGTQVYTSANGTSFSCPHVVGAAALLFAAYPNATAEDVKAALLETVDLLPGLTNRMVSNGRLNVGKALVESSLTTQPKIFRQPQNQTVVAGNTVVLTVGVRGRMPLEYQWYFENSPVEHATNQTLVLNNIEFANEGEYRVVVSNALGSATSDVAVVTVGGILITSQPISRGVRPGSDVTFSVGVISSEAVTYHWRFNSSPISGGSGLTLSLTNVQSTDDGLYSVVISNSLLSVTSAPARLTLLAGPAQIAYLKASNPGAFDEFGWAVAMSGDTVVVGAPDENSSSAGINGSQDDDEMINAGAVYVFVRRGDEWIQQAYLKASNPGVNDFFGNEVAIFGDTILVGAPGEDSNATGVNGNQGNNSANDAGAAYVFVRDGTNWTQQAYLKASNPGALDAFGVHVALFGDTAVIGAWGEDSSAAGVNGNQANNSMNESGAAYVFVRDGTNWSQQAYLKASNPGAEDQFGLRVSISGDTVVVTANAEDSAATGVNGNQSDNSAQNSGAAYVFVRTGTSWSQQAYLKASNTAANDNFGITGPVNGETIVIGAAAEDSNAKGVNGNQQNNSATDSGAAYVFVRNGTTWTQQAYLKASNTGSDDRFGRSASISGDTIVVGARQEDSGATGINSIEEEESSRDSGAAYVYVRNGTNWSQQTYLKPSNTGAGDNSGFSVAVVGDLVASTAYLENGGSAGPNGDQNDESVEDSGAVYLFTDLGSAGPPGFVISPRSQSVLSGGRAAFHVEAFGKTPLTYRWYFDSGAIPNATNASLVLDGVTAAYSGQYTVSVTDARGSIVSNSAVLTVSPLLVTQELIDRSVPIGSNVTFSFGVLSALPVSYRWFFNGSPLANAGSANLTITNVQIAHEGIYSVVASNASLVVTSAPARLSPYMVPVFVQALFNQSTISNGNVTLSVVIEGYPPPFGFQWRQGQAPILTYVQTNKVSYFTVTNLRGSVAYRVYVTNAASPDFVVNSGCLLTAQSDTNSNGLADPWEATYKLTDPGGDPDGDLMTNLQEYQANTDPTNALSSLTITPVQITETNCILDFLARPARTYSVEYAEGLSSGVWLKVADIPARSVQRVERVVHDAAPSGERYYRIVSPRR